MKITVKNFDDLTRAQMKEVIEQMGECYNVDYLTNDDYSRSVVNAEVAVGEEDGCIYDVRVYDPYQHINTGEFIPVFIGAYGWSYWLFGYHDLDGNDVDTIIDEFDGELQGI